MPWVEAGCVKFCCANRIMESNIAISSKMSKYICRVFSIFTFNIYFYFECPFRAYVFYFHTLYYIKVREYSLYPKRLPAFLSIPWYYETVSNNTIPIKRISWGLLVYERKMRSFPHSTCGLKICACGSCNFLTCLCFSSPRASIQCLKATRIFSADSFQ